MAFGTQSLVRMTYRAGRLAMARARAELHRSVLRGVVFRQVGADCRFWGAPAIRYGALDVVIGRNCDIGEDTFWSVTPPAWIRIGEGVSVNWGCVLVAEAGIEIGDGTRIGERVSIRDQDHRVGSAPIRDSGFVAQVVRIGPDCWLGANVVVTKGVVIGGGSVVGAGAVVTASLPEFAVAMGVPARVVGDRRTWRGRVQ